MEVPACSLFFLVISLAPPMWAQATSPAGGAAAVQPIPLKTPAASALTGRKASYTVTVPGTGAWVDAGFAVEPGDHIEVSATGKVTLADGRESGPEGVAKGWKDLLRGFPAENANAGALVGRIGNSNAAVPFAVGGALNEDVPASGELFFATNTDAAGTGEYKTTVKLSKAADAKTQASPVDVEKLGLEPLIAAMPRRDTDPQGNPGDVANFAIVGTKAEVQKAFTAAGWVQVDRSDDAAILHGLLATLSKQAYLAMPMSTLDLFGRPQDLSYARAEPLAVALVRHHLRVWDSGKTVDGRPLWVGSATHDNGLERDERNNGVTHHIDPNIDVERDFIEQSFAAAGALEAAAYVTPPNPVRDAKTATGGSFQTDGRILVMLLRPQ